MTKAEPPLLLPFLEKFWTYDESPYVEKRQDQEQRISRRHCYDQLRHVKNHWTKHFAGVHIDEVGLHELDTFEKYVKAQGLVGKSINNILSGGIVAFKWMAKRKMILWDPMEGLGKFAVRNKVRGALTPTEVREIFGLPWEDERARQGNLLACTCGLRSGEVLSLQVGDVHGQDEKCFIACSWNRLDLFTDPKWGSCCNTSIAHPIKEALLRVASKSPFPATPDLLIFHGQLPNRPRGGSYLLDALKNMLLQLNPTRASGRDGASTSIVGGITSRPECLKFWMSRR